MAAHPQPCVAVVAHGTVISLLAAHLTGRDPWAVWQALPLLGHVTVSWPSQPPQGTSARPSA